jgi:hypothetical protein
VIARKQSRELLKEDRASRYPEEPAGLLALDPQLVCYSWVTGIADVRKWCLSEAAG